MPKVLVIGLDGATFDIIQPLVADGRLPNLARILQSGAWGALNSAIPPITPTAWTSIFTGKNPGKYGIYNFKEFVPETYELRTLRINEHREKAIWHLLGEMGKRNIILDVPFTYPPQPLEGIMLTGYGTPRTSETVFTYPSAWQEVLPPDLYSEIRVAVPKHRFDRSQAFIDEWRVVMNGRRRLLQHLLTEETWDFFFHVFTITDNLAHIFWTYVDPNHPNYHLPEGPHYREAFFDGYEQCDALLGDMMTWAGSDTTTLIVSDHGFGSVYPRQYLFKRLADGGYLKYQSPPFLSVFSDRLMKVAMGTYTRFPFLRERVKKLRPNGQKAVRQALKQTGLMPSPQAIDYGRSPILTTGYGVQIWVNEQGKFASGPVPSAQKEGLIKEVTDYLLSDKDSSTGQPIIAAVHRGRDVYHGSAAEKGPDIVIEYNNFYDPQASYNSNPYIEGGHTPQGIFLAHGPHIQPGQIEPTELVDLAPTILHLYGHPMPPDMDGRVLTEIFTPQFQRNTPIETGTEPARFAHVADSGQFDYTPEEQAELERQLRQLGYL